jgi:hypothetical protein
MWEEIWSRFELSAEEKISGGDAGGHTVREEVEAYHLLAFMTGYVPKDSKSDTENLKHA